MSLVLGVLGGMGPAATVDFLAKIQAATPAKRDQDHVRVLVDLNPQVPDRNDPFNKPGPVLAEMAAALGAAGAQVLAIACNTAHEHAPLIQKVTGLPLVDMIETAVARAEGVGARRAGVLGTPVALRLYREYLAARGMGAVLLDAEHQQRFMELIYRIKAGDLGEEVQAGMAQLVDRLEATGAEALIAGCTEVPLVYDGFGARLMFVDPSAETARRCVDVCLGHAPVPTVHTSAF